MPATDGDLGQSSSPGATETVSDDYRDGKFEALFELAMQVCGGAVGISGSRSAWRPPFTFETSTPLLAQMSPWRVSVITHRACGAQRVGFGLDLVQ
jgi:hypothetical protein